MVALCERQEPDHGRNPKLSELTNADYDSLSDRLMMQSGNDPLWIFAYGSLIWNPTFAAVEHKRATAFGWHRSFCLELTNWRGTPAQPGLMMALDNGGRCNGLVYRIEDGQKRSAINDLLDREVGCHEDVRAIRWIPVAVGKQNVRALVFWAGPRGVGVSRRLPLEKVAWILARACGHMGSGASYLFHTVANLEHHGIHDRNLWRLQEMVAREIVGLHGGQGDGPRSSKTDDHSLPLPNART